jgi:peroxiredoxin
MKYVIAGVPTIALLILGAAHRPLHAAEPSGVRAAIKAVGQRKPAPAFRLADASNRVVPLSRYRGNVVLLDFWATECGGCKVEIPWFMEFKRIYQSRRFEVVGVSMDVPYESLKDAAEGWKRVRPFVRSHQVNYPILMGDDNVTKTYGITALPVTYLLDRSGRIAAEYPGLVDREDIVRNIKTLLNER